MAKLTRVLQKIFGSTGSTSEFGEIGSQAAGSATTTKDLATIQSLSQFLEGLYAITNSAGEPPRIQDLNSLYLLITSQLKYLFQEGVSEYSATEDYYIGSICQVAGVLYTSKTDSNTGNAVTNTTYWKKTLDIGELSGLGTYWVNALAEALGQAHVPSSSAALAIDSSWNSALHTALASNIATALANVKGFGSLATSQGYITADVVATLLYVGESSGFSSTSTNIPDTSHIWYIVLVAGSGYSAAQNYLAFSFSDGLIYRGRKNDTNGITWTRIQTQDMYGSNWTTALASALGTNWTTALASALGTNWTTALASALGTNWTALLASSVGVPASHGYFEGTASTTEATIYNAIIPAFGSSPVTDQWIPISGLIYISVAVVLTRAYYYMSGTGEIILSGMDMNGLSRQIIVRASNQLAISGPFSISW